MDARPPVSCMCLTYGRPQLLEEAIESFLRQDYAGPKELVVLNDFAEQELVFEHPEVHVINLERRFRTVGEKRNAVAALCAYDWLAVWDDDDVYLPWRLSYSMDLVDPARMFFKSSRALVLEHGAISRIGQALFHSGGLWHRDLFELVRGYAHMGSGEDLELEVAMEREHVGPGKNFDEIPAEWIYYLYRWAGSGSYHLSGFGEDREGQPSGNQRVAEWVQRRVEAGEVPTGRIELQPRWAQDYVALAAAFVEAERDASLSASG